MALDERKRTALDKVFKTKGPEDADFWRPSSDAADAAAYNAEIGRAIADAEQNSRFRSKRNRQRRVDFLKGARIETPTPYVSGLSDEKRAVLDKVFGFGAARRASARPEGPQAPVTAMPETIVPTSSLLSSELSEVEPTLETVGELQTGAVSAPAEKTGRRMPVERFDVRGMLNPTPVRSGVLLDPKRSEAPAAGDMVLPSGTVLRKSDRDLDEFFREQVMPGIEPVQAAADERARKVLAGQGEARDRRWLGHFNIDPVGDYVTDAVQTAATSRRERGPARIVEEVLSGIDPGKANAYIADRLADDPEFAAAAERLQKAVPAVGDVSEEEIEQLQTALSPAQRKQYDKAVAEEQKRIAGEQEAFQKAADAAWKRQAQQFQQGITERLVEEMARRNMPESELDAFTRIALNASVPGMLTEWTVSNATGGDKALHAQIMQRALEKYNPSIWTRMGGDVAGLLSSGPVFAAGGALGKAGAAVLRRAAERNVMKRLMARGITEGAEGVARRLVAGSMAQRLAQGLVASGTTLGTYDAVATPLAMAATGENPSFGDIIGAMGRGFATGALLPGIGMATGRVADAATSRLGRYAAELGGFAAENAAFVGMGTLYDGLRTGEWGSPEQLAEDFAHSVGVLGIMKSVGALKRGRAKNPGFYDKVIAETEFTPEEVDALGRAGVDGRSYKRAVFDLLNAKETASGREVAERAAEQLGSCYADVMRSPEVPVSAKAKLMYLVEGRIPERLPLTTDVRRTVGEDGRTTVDLLDPAGNLVQRRTFSSEKAAEAFERESAGVREVNSIQYYEALIDRVQAFDEASQAYAVERGVPVETVKNEVRKAVGGQPYDKELVRRVVELSGQTGVGTVDLPGMLAAEIGRRHGLQEGGFEQALARREEVRTPEERAAVAEYAARLKEIATQELRQEPTPEERAERQLAEMAEQEIAQVQNRDDGVIYTATMQDGRQANIIKGANLVYDPETGEVDAAQSDPTVVVRYEDGTMRQVSVREIDMIVEAVSTDDARAEALKAIREQLDTAAREEALAEAVETGGLVQLKDGRIGAVEGVNEDGSFNVAVQDAEGRIVTGRVETGDIVGPVGEESVPETVGSDGNAVPAAAAATDPLVGRSLTDEEAGQVIGQMEAAAEPAPELELTPENWVAEFGEEGKVQTPVGEVKMGENQLSKLFLKGRSAQFGMVKPTLETPDCVIEIPTQSKDGNTERPSSLLFVKAFTGKDGQKHYFFTSVTVQKDDMEVSVSNHLENRKRIADFLKKGKLLYRVYGGAQTEQRPADVSVTASPSDMQGFSGEDTTTVPENQIAEAEIPRQKDGQPDFNAMPADMLAVELSAAVGHDKAVERLQVARGVNAKSMNKLRKSLDGMGDLNKAMAVEQRIAAMQQEDARLAGALEQLGAADEPVVGKASAENFSQEIERLFPEGLPNVRAQVLADIARGQRFVWNDSPDGTKRGVATELGFMGNESERRARFGMLGSEATGAKHVSSYVHDLWEDSNGYALDMDDAALRDEVIDVLLATPSRASAMAQLRDMAARHAEDDAAPRDAEDLAAAKAYDQERNNGRTEPVVAEQPGSDDVPFSEAAETSVEESRQQPVTVSEAEARIPAAGDEKRQKLERRKIRIEKKREKIQKEAAGILGIPVERMFSEGYAIYKALDETQKQRLVDLNKEFMKSADELDAVNRELRWLNDDVPFSVVGDVSAAPAGVTPERWNVIVDQLRRVIGAENVVTDPEAVRAAYDRITGRGMEIRRQQVAEINERFNEQLEQLTPENADSMILDMGMPSPEMLAVGMADKPLRLYGNKLLKKAKRHGYNLSDVRDLPQAIEHPIAIFKGRYSGSYAILTALNIGGDNVLATIDINKGAELNVNIITSVYGKERNLIERWIQADKMLYVNKKKALDYLIPPALNAGDPSNVRLSSEKVLNWIAAGGSFGPSGINQGLVTATNIVTNFENPKIEPENIVPQEEKTRYFRTPEGEVYGFTAGGKIYLDSSRMNAATPMHEYTELWSQIVARENPAWWNRAKEIMRGDTGRLGEIWQEVDSDPNYRDLGEDLRASETLSRATGEWFSRKQAGIRDHENLFMVLKRLVREFWRKIKSAFAKWSDKELARMKADDVMGAPLKDFVEGIDLQKYRDEKTLAGVHNISPEKLKKALKQGGLANPSAAVIDVEKQSHEGYGEISLILPSSLVDKRTGRNAGTWTADAWTPTYPDVERQFSDGGGERFARDMATLPGAMYAETRMGMNNWLEGRGSRQLAYMFLHERGEAPELQTVPVRYGAATRKAVEDATQGAFDLYNAGPEERQAVLEAYIGEKFGGDRAAYEQALAGTVARMEGLLNNERALVRRRAAETLAGIRETGFDYKELSDFVRSVGNDVRRGGTADAAATNEAAVKQIEDNGLQGEFDKWVDGFEDRYGIREVLFDGFTPSGMRRYLPNTLENASKMMKAAGRNGATGMGISFNNFAAGLLDSLGSLKDIRARKGSLTTNHEEVDAFREKWSQVFFELGEKCQPDAKGYDDYGLYRLAEAARKRDPQSYLKKEYGVNLSDEDAARLKEMVKAIRTEMPAMYFETKFERPVYLNEMAGAVVPENTDKDILDALDAAGIPYRTYSTAEERPQVIREFSEELEGVRFSTNGEKARIREQARRDGTYLKAPNGQPSKLTADQWETVRTRQFKEWFGDWENEPENASKIVDENGEPMVVYHGTPLSRNQITPNRGWHGDDYVSQEAPFHTFRGGEYSGLIFTSVDYDQARIIASRRSMEIPDDERGNEQWTEEGYVYDLYANVKKPFDPQDRNAMSEVLHQFGDKIPTLSFYGGKGDSVSPDVALKMAASESNSWMLTETPEFLSKVKELGYDGLVGYDEWVKYIAVVSPDQIKSATENIGAFDPANPDIRFNREFTERRVTTLEKLENKRDALIADRGNIANFDERLAAVDAEIEAYMQSDPVAETFGKDGAGDAHLQAMEDAVYDIVRKEGVDGVQVDVVRSADDLLEYARGHNWHPEDIQEIGQGILKPGYYGDGEITILASLIKNRKTVAGVFWHERTHGITDKLRAPEQLTQAAEEAGAELLDAALADRGYSTGHHSMERMADEYVSRGVEILAKKGLLDDYLAITEAGIEPIEAHLTERNVPDMLRGFIIDSCKYIKNQKYGTEERILLRAGDTGGSTALSGDEARLRTDDRASVEADEGTDGGGDVALRRGFSGSERVPAAERDEGGVRAADEVGVHPTRGGDLEGDSVLYGTERTRQNIPGEVERQLDSRLFPAREGDGTADETGGRTGTAGDAVPERIGTGAAGVAADAGGRIGGRGGDLDRPSFSFGDSGNDAPKLTKQQQLIADLRRAVRESKAAARSVAQIVSRRVRREVGTDLVEIMGKREFDALIRQIEEATARQEVEKPLQRIAEVVTDLEIKRLQKVVDDFLKLKVQGEGPRGVSVAKEVDDRTRRMFEIFRNNLDRPAAEVAGELREQEDADILYDLDAVSALEAYQEAVRYGREVDEIDREVEALRARNTQLRRERIAANKVGHKELFELLKKQILYNNELIDALEAERVETKGHRAGALKETAGLLSGQIGAGREILSEWKKQEEERRRKIANDAFRDVDGGSKVPVLDKRPGVWTQGYRRTVEFLLSPAYSMDYLLKMISVNAPKGEGALYDHFMRGTDGYVEARGRYYLGYEDFKRVLDEKARALFGKSYPKVLADSNAPTEATITITNAAPRKPGQDKQKGTDAGNPERTAAAEEYNPTIGEALYIYMVNKMTDGRVKLKRMGITEEEVDALAGILPARYVQFADWLQNEFLPERRKTYNATHLAVFGTQMARIENYVPLKILKSYVWQEVDGSEPDPDTLPSAITGSIIRRTRNNQILNLHTNALDLMLEHGQQMEHWNAFTRVVLDMNALLTSTKFRRMLDTRNPGLHKRLKVAAQLAADSYRPQVNDVNRAWIALGKLAASSKIAFRVNTALKQVLSYPAFYAYSPNPKFWAQLTKNLAPTTWAKNFRWCIDNIPSFRERWLGRMAGNEKLAQMTAPLLDKWLDKMNQYGMLPNAFVDALTCANGAKAVYDFRRAEYMKRGRDEAEAERLARIDAAVSINATQQSSEGMYLGQMQADRDFWSVSMSTFQNANFAYLRKQLEGIDELFRDTMRERRNRTEYYKERGFSEDEASDLALKEVVEAKLGALLNIGIFMFGLNILWELGNNVWKYLFAPETRDEIPGELAKSAFVAAVRNTTVGSLAEGFASGYGANPSVLLSDMIAFTNRLRRIVEKENPDAWNETAAYLILQTLSANGLGIDLESFVNMYQGIAGWIRDGWDVEDLMRMLNAPQSQAKLLAGKPKEGETEEEYHERMIFTERRIAERVGKKRRDKWTRNYTAYRQAEALGMRAERDIYGNVTVSELKQLDAEYAAALKNSGVTAAGGTRKDYDWQALTPEQKKRWQKRARMAWKISEEEKELDAVIVYNERYAERMRQLMAEKREYVVDVENNK